MYLYVIWWSSWHPCWNQSASPPQEELLAYMHSVLKNNEEEGGAGTQLGQLLGQDNTLKFPIFLLKIQSVYPQWNN
jgi:hypothetical protein